MCGGGDIKICFPYVYNVSMSEKYRNVSTKGHLWSGGRGGGGDILLYQLL